MVWSISVDDMISVFEPLLIFDEFLEENTNIENVLFPGAHESVFLCKSFEGIVVDDSHDIDRISVAANKLFFKHDKNGRQVSWVVL